MIWYGSTSETVRMQIRQKNWLKFTNFTELKKITSGIYSNCLNHSSLFFRFVPPTSYCTSVLLSAYFTFYFIADFQKKSKECLYCFF